MSSIEERMKCLPRIVIDSVDQFVLEVSNDGVKYCELLITIDKLDFELNTGKSNVELSHFNPKKIER